MSSNYQNFECVCVEGASIQVARGKTGAISLECWMADGVLISQADAKNMALLLLALVSKPHPDNARSEQCADAAWYLVRFGRGMWNACKPNTVAIYLRNATPSRIICDAEGIQWDRAITADRAQEIMVGRPIVRLPGIIQ